MASAGQVKVTVKVDDATQKLAEIARFVRETGDPHRAHGYVLARTAFGETRRRVLFIGPDDIAVRKAWIGYWVDGYWCPTRRVRDYWIDRRWERR